MIKYVRPGDDAGGVIYRDGTIQYEGDYFDSAGNPTGPPPRKCGIQRRIRLDRKLVEGWYEDPKYKLIILPNRAVFVAVKGRRLTETELKTPISVKRTKYGAEIKFIHKTESPWFHQLDDWCHIPEVAEIKAQMEIEREEEKRQIAENLKEVKILIEEIKAYLKEIATPLEEEETVVEATYTEGYVFGFGKHDYSGAYNKKGQVKIIARHEGIPVVDKPVNVWSEGEKAYTYKEIWVGHAEGAYDGLKASTLARIEGFNYRINVKSLEEFKQRNLPQLFLVGERVVKLIPREVKGLIQEWDDKEMR